MLSTFQQLAATRRPVHLGIGMFDGLHLGHQAVLGTTRHAADNETGVCAVLTFDPHPSAVLRPDQRTLLMMTPEAKQWRLQQMRMDGCVIQKFDAAYAQTGAEQFLPWLKERLPNLRAVYVGENWRFGRGRGGDVSALLGHAKALGVSVYSAPRISFDGEPISSTRIRTELVEGDIEAVNRLLGYHYFSLGNVVPGRQIGRTIGLPTLNLSWAPELQPRRGVYVARVALAPATGGAWSPLWMPAVANYGVRPTVGEAAVPLLEAHVLGPCPIGPGERVVVEWLKFLRPERKFEDLEALKAQIFADREIAADWFGAM